MQKEERREGIKARKKEHEMLVGHHEPEDVFARMPEVAAQTDPVTKEGDRLL